MHICWRRVIVKSIVRAKCPDCKKNARFIVLFFEWEGPHKTCLNCGRQYWDNEWVRLDFNKSARKRCIEKAKEGYRSLNINPECSEFNKTFVDNYWDLLD